MQCGFVTVCDSSSCHRGLNFRSNFDDRGDGSSTASIASGNTGGSAGGLEKAKYSAEIRNSSRMNSIDREDLERFRSLITARLGLFFEDDKLDELSKVMGTRILETKTSGVPGYFQRITSKTTGES